MNVRIPFNLYDFFGYLASGLLIIVGMEFILGFPHVLGQDLTTVDLAALVLGAYVAGQCVSTLAKMVLEDGLVEKVLGRPSENLFLEKRPRVRGFLAPGFYQPLPKERRQQILKRARNEGVSETGEALFLHVRFSPNIRGDATVMGRLNGFLANYGFARNLGFTSLIVGVAMLVASHFLADPDPGLVKYGATALVTGIFLVYRYLKFFRQYSYEMFNTYAKGD